jgi:hypothetical protein
MTRHVSRPSRVLVAIGALASGALVFGASARRAAAQVGHAPEQSPFIDLEARQTLTFEGGYLFTAKDPAGVAPRSGPLARVQYDVFLGGPAWFTARLGSALVERTVVDPARPLTTRVLGQERRPLTMLDAGFTFALTGAKSYKGIVPLIHTGLGLVSNGKGADPGGLSLGTRFALAYGVGMRYVGSGRLSMRVDAGRTMYQLRYPDRYFENALDSTSVLPSGASKSKWLNNTAVTLGASYQLFR